MIQHLGFRGWSVALTAGLLIVLASTGLAACGFRGSTQSGSSVSQRQAQVTRSSQQIQVQKCGFVFGYGTLKLVPRDEDSSQAENCFWQAYQHCRPAMLVFTSGSIGKVVATETFTRTFTIHNVNGTCSISDARQEGTSANALSPAVNFTCTGLIRSPRALDILSCGQDGTVHVLGA